MSAAGFTVRRPKSRARMLGLWRLMKCVGCWVHGASSEITCSYVGFVASDEMCRLLGNYFVAAALIWGDVAAALDGAMGRS